MLRNMLCAASIVLTLAAAILTWNEPATLIARTVAYVATGSWLFLIVLQEVGERNPRD